MQKSPSPTPSIRKTGAAALPLVPPAAAAASDQAAPLLQAQAGTSSLLNTASPAPAKNEAYEDDHEDADLASWMESLAQTIADTDVADPHKLQQCFHDLGRLRDAIARGASLSQHRDAASGLAHGLHQLLQELVRHIQANVVSLHKAGPDMQCVICSGLSLFAELHAAKAFSKTHQATLRPLLSQLSGALAGAVRGAHVAGDADDVAATLALLTWLTRALKAGLLYADDKALRAAFSDGLACMRDWTTIPEGGAPRKSSLLNSQTLTVCFVQLNTIRQYELLHLEGDSNKARANRADLQALLKALCAALPTLLSGDGVQLANVCNTIKDYADAGLLPDATHGWLMPTITLLLQRMPAVPRKHLVQRGGQVLANCANFLRVLFESDWYLKASFVGCAAGYRDACIWLASLLAQPQFSLAGKLDQSLANLMSFVKAMLKMQERSKRTKTQDAAETKPQWILPRSAARQLIRLAQTHLLGPRPIRPSPMSLSGMLLAVWDFEARGVVAPEACQALMQHLLQAIPDCAGAEWQAESLALCLRVIVHLQGQEKAKPGPSGTQGMRAAFTHLLALLGKSRVRTEVHQLYCLQALRLGLQEQWISMDAPAMQKALCKLLDWTRREAPGSADLEAAIARLAHREEALPAAPDAELDDPEPAAPTDTSGWTPPGGKLAAVTGQPQLKTSTTYRAPISTSAHQPGRPTNTTASGSKSFHDSDEEDDAFGLNPVRDWFLLASGRKEDKEALARMRALAEKHPQLLNQTDAGGNPALYYAIVNGQQALARWLMAQPRLEPGIPRADFIERLAEGLLDSDKPQKAKRLYEEFKAASKDAEDDQEGDDAEPSNEQSGTEAGKPGIAGSQKHPKQPAKRKPRTNKGTAEFRKDGESKQAANTAVDHASVQNRDDAFALGMRYASGEGIEKNAALACKWLGAAAEQGHAEAQYQLAMWYEADDDVEKSPALAIHWLEKAVVQGHAKAQVRSWEHYRENLFGTGDDARGVKLLTKLAEKGDLVAQGYLGRLYESGTGVRKDYKLALHWLGKAAALGNAMARYDLGMKYLKGTGVKKDLPLAMNYLHQAAKQGCADAQYNLGTWYLDGNGVEMNEKLAFDLLSAAAEQGCMEAQQTLAFMYAAGSGVEKNLTLRRHWLTKAAEQGLDSAQLELGRDYEVGGLGVPQDNALALHWISRAAGQGMAAAMTKLGALLLAGKIVSKDEKRAFDLFTRAAAKGDDDAVCQLAFVYLYGHGTKKNVQLSMLYMKQAAAMGNRAAKELLAGARSMFAGKMR